MRKAPCAHLHSIQCALLAAPLSLHRIILPASTARCKYRDSRSHSYIAQPFSIPVNPNEEGKLVLDVEIQLMDCTICALRGRKTCKMKHWCTLLLFSVCLHTFQCTDRPGYLQHRFLASSVHSKPPHFPRSAFRHETESAGREEQQRGLPLQLKGASLSRFLSLAPQHRRVQI